MEIRLRNLAVTLATPSREPHSDSEGDVGGRPSGDYESFFPPTVHTVEVAGPTLSCDILMLLQSGSYSGVQVQVQGEVILAHSQILRARSQVFNRQVA